MAELTPEMQAAGVFVDANGVPTNPDGTPLPGWGAPIDQPPVSDGGAGILAQIAATQGLVAGEAPGGGPAASPDPLGYGYAPLYNASPQDYPENRTPMTPANFGLPDDWDFRSGEPGSWEQLHTPNDRSTGGGFFTADDQFTGQIPTSFQQGASSPSTNNYRLLPPEYRTPQFIMRNGYIIDRMASGAGGLHGPGSAEAGSWIMQHTSPLWSQGSSVTTGWPAGVSYGHGLSFGGWPGAYNWASGGYGNQGSA